MEGRGGIIRLYTLSFLGFCGRIYVCLTFNNNLLKYGYRCNSSVDVKNIIAVMMNPFNMGKIKREG